MVLSKNIIDFERAASLPKEGEVLQPTGERWSRKGSDSIAKFLTEPLTPLPEGGTIEIPAGDVTKMKFRENSDLREGMSPEALQRVNIPAEEMKGLETKVKLIALADKAMSGDVQLAGTNLSLPNKGPAPNVGLA